MRRTVRVALAAVALSAVAAGCGASKTGGASPNTSAKAPSGSAASGSTAAGSSSGLPLWDENRRMNDTSGFSSPMATAMGYDPSKDPTAQQAEFRQQEQKRQEAVAECMKADGWEYTAYVPSNMGTFTQPGYDLTRKEYVEKYGFGISTSFEESQQPANQTQPEHDPNMGYVSGLSQSEQEAYNKSLYGDGMSATPIDGSTDATTADGGTVAASPDGNAVAATIAAGQVSGCMGKGDLVMNGGTDATAADRAFLDDMNKRIQTFYEKVQADPRIVAANRGYGACMAEKGYPEIDKQQTVYEKVNEKMNGLFGGGPDGSASDGGVVATVASASASASATSAAPGASSQGPAYDPAKLAEVKTYEIAVARADLACGKDVLKANYEVSSALEKAFVDENKTDLERFGQLNKAGVSGSGSGG